MIYRHTQREIDDYHNSPEINQSGIKAILGIGVEAYIDTRDDEEEEYAEEKTHFTVGKGVDCLMTQGDECFKERYHFNDLSKKPAEKPMLIVKLVYAAVLAQENEKLFSGKEFGKIEEDFSKYETLIWEAMNQAEYYMNRAKPFPQDKRIEGLLADGSVQAYWEDLIKSQGKQILTVGQQSVIYTIANSFKLHPYTKDLFDEDKYGREDYDVIYQLPLFWSEIIDVGGQMFTEQCKGLLDMVVVDHKAQNILPIDIKTLGDYVTRFPYWLRKRRYDIQGAFYMRGVNRSKKRISEVVARDVSGYRVQNFGFVVESTIKPGTPIKYPMTDELIEVATEGDGKIEGIKDGLRKYADFKRHGYSVENIVGVTRGTVWIDEFYKPSIPCL